jgi:glycosyltransferase involved in cell wall biosynthesis
VHGLFVEARDTVDLAHAIARLDDDRALLSRMAQSGRARVLAHYTVARLADDFTRIYESLGVKV